MNSLKTFGKAVYGTGFGYTFGTTFYDCVCNFDSEKFVKASMTDYALFSSTCVSVGILTGIVWPLTFSTRFLIEQNRK